MRFRPSVQAAVIGCVLSGVVGSPVTTNIALAAEPPKSSATAERLNAGKNDAERNELIRERDRLGEEAGRLRSAGKLAEAITRVRRMIEIERLVSGPNHLETANVVEYLADLLEDADDWPGALQARDDAAAMYRTTDGPDHWRTRIAEERAGTTRTIAAGSAVDRRSFRESEHDEQIGLRLLNLRLFDAADARLKRAWEVRKRLLADGALSTALVQLHRGRVRIDSGRPGEALPLLTEVDAVFRRVYGDDHRDRLVCLHLTAQAQAARGQRKESLNLLRETLERRSRVMRADHPVLHATADELATSLGEAAADSLEKDGMKEALADAKERAALCRRFFGERGSATVQADVELKHLQRRAEQTDQARRELRDIDRLLTAEVDLDDGPAMARRLERLDAAAGRAAELLGDDDPLWSRCYGAVGELAAAAEQFDVAEQLADIAAKASVSIYGAKHPRTIAAMVKLARIQESFARTLVDAEDDALREGALERAAQTYTAARGEKNPKAIDVTERLRIHRVLMTRTADERAEYQKILDGLDRSAKLRAQRKFREAEDPIRQALVYFDTEWNGRHVRYAECLGNLGVLALDQGDLAAARPNLERAVEAYKKILGDMHPRTAGAISELGVWCLRAGDPGTAETYFQEALAIVSADDDLKRDRARYLDALGQCYLDRGELTPAVDPLTEALHIYLAESGPDASETARSWNNLGALFRRLRDFETTEALYDRAAAVWRNTDDPIDLAMCLDGLALVRLAVGRYPEALSAAEEGRSLFAKYFDAQHHDVLTNASICARCLLSVGRGAEAYEAASRAFTGGLQRWESMAHQLSSEQRLYPAADLRHALHLLVRSGTAAGVPAEQIYGHVLRVKGNVLERSRRDRLKWTALARNGDSEVTKLRDELRSVDRQFAEASFAIVAPADEAARRDRLQAASQRRTELQVQLARRAAADVAEPRRTVLPSAGANDDVPTLRARIPADVALVDFVYLAGGDGNDANGNDGDRDSEPATLVAFVVTRDRAVRVVDFGPSGPIDDAIHDWRATCGQVETGKHADAAKLLRERIWDRLPADVQALPTVLFVPEGPLTRFPWGALPGSDAGRFLIEERQIAVVPSALWIAEASAATAATKKPKSALLLGAVDYGKPASGRPGGAWRPLGGTRNEILQLRALLQAAEYQTTTLEGEGAEKGELLRELPAHRWVHLATHGFFDAPEYQGLLVQATPSVRRSTAGLMFGVDYSIREPGLLSVAVLAGANRANQGDGLLTALELTDLDLDGVDLVTISACESGLGRLHPAEGTLGLTRALHAAGVRTCVTSLWPVDDEATAELMTEFYRQMVVDDRGPLAALCGAQRKLLGKSRSPTVRVLRGADLPDSEPTFVGSPYYWAAFTLSGDWR
jgi:CHAT domain-containing protein/tetratricopeptide (TPR) repeat protein